MKALIILIAVALICQPARGEIKLKQSTPSQRIPLGYFVDPADGKTGKTALLIAITDIKVWKAGATSLVNKNSGGATHMADGVYNIVLDATDTNTIGPLVIFVNHADALPIRVECEVLPASLYDAWYAGTLPANVTQFGGAPGTFGSGRPEVNTTHWGGTAVASANVPANVTQWNGANVPTPDTAGYPKVTIKDGTGQGEVITNDGIAWADLSAIRGSVPNANNARDFFSIGYGVHALSSAITAVNSQTVFTITNGPETDNALNGYTVIVSDSNGGEDGGIGKSTRTVVDSDYDMGITTVTIDSAAGFTVTTDSALMFLPPK